MNSDNGRPGPTLVSPGVPEARRRGLRRAAWLATEAVGGGAARCGIARLVRSLPHPTTAMMKLLQLGFLPASSSLALAVLRLWLGLSMLLLHGWGKLAGFSQMSAQFPDPLGIGHPASLVLAVLAEALCAALLVLGLFTRLAALVLAIELAVAFALIHGHALSGEHSGETAFIYLAGYVALVIGGGGCCSLDGRMGRKTA